MTNLNRNILQSVIDSLPEQIAVINAQGNIIATNSSWDITSRGRIPGSIICGNTGENYIDLCMRTFEKDKKLNDFLNRTTDLLNGRIDKVSLDYTLEKSKKKKWYKVRITPIRTDQSQRAAVIINKDITRQKNLELNTKRLISTDYMTGVLNRKSGIKRLTREIKTAGRTGNHLSLCYIDIDNLKIINDNFGHMEGDEAIIQIVEIIKDTLRETDDICRIGGDEFLIIFPDTSSSQAGMVMQRVTGKIDEYNRKKLKPYQLDISFGFAEYEIPGKLSPEELIETADKEMYRMKREHKNDYTNFIINVAKKKQGYEIVHAISAPLYFNP